MMNSKFSESNQRAARRGVWYCRMLLLAWLLSLMRKQFCYGELWQQALFKCMFVIAPNVAHVTNCNKEVAGRRGSAA